MLKLLWLDLETTSLDPRHDLILEVAVFKADLERPFEVQPVLRSVVHFPRWRHEYLDPKVLEMHTKNGLLEECACDDAPSIEVVESRLLEHVPIEPERGDRPVLAGSSIHFDYSFLQAHMPRVFKRLSYRLYDVSALKLYCQSMGMPKFKKAEAHRAQADVLESIAHAKECTAWLQANLRSNQP